MSTTPHHPPPPARFLQIAQEFLAETALKSFCGKKANDLSAAVAEGRLLGMSEEAATAIFNEVASPDFVSDSDYYYKKPSGKYDGEDPAAALKKKMEEEGTDVSGESVSQWVSGLIGG